MAVGVLRKMARQAPARPGVYLWRGGAGLPIYVGKAKDLRARLASYFTRGPTEARKAARLRRESESLEWIETGTEIEALILEDRLIKKYRPRYNVRLRDDKTYPYLKLHRKDPFPYLEVTRKVVRDGSLYFGPYVSARSLRATLRLLHRHFRIRQCRGPLGPASRPCVNSQIGICSAPCAGEVSREDYARRFREVTLLLRGRGEALLTGLTDRMEEASAKQEYEEAARLRDQIAAARQVTRADQVVSGRGEDQDILAAAWEGESGFLEVLHVRQGRMAGRSRIQAEGIDGSPPEILQELLVRYYGKEIAVPPEILVAHSLPGADLVVGWLREKRGRAVRIRTPRRGRGHDLLRLAQRSVQVHLRTRRSGAEETRALQKALDLPRLPERIEGYDIAHLGGSFAVASLVAFVHGRPDRKGYRRYRLREPAGGDDHQAFREVLARRMARREQPGWELPDLILIDGGRGHLETARTVLADLEEAAPMLLSLAKIRGSRSVEGVFLPEQPDEAMLPRGSSALLYLQRIRDESHRFANEYHRLLRSRAATRSILEEVPGIGPGRRKELLTRFGGLAGLRAASLDELASVPGIDRRAAGALRSLLDYLAEPESIQR